MAEAILKQGFEQIGFLGTQMPLDHRARKRFEGFTDTLAKAGYEVADQEFYSGGSSLKKGREMTEAMLSRNPDIDFLYYSNDMIGAGGLLWCLEQGIEIPDRMGLAGFNGTELLEGLPRYLATMDAGRRETGREAARIITGRADGTVTEPERFEIEPRIEFGDTLRRYKP